MEKKNILILGSTGYLGNILTKYFSNKYIKDLELFTLNRRQSKLNFAIKDYVEEDYLKDSSVIERIIRKNNIDVVIDLVWENSYGDGRYNSISQDNNLNLKKTIMESVSKFPNIHLISIGTTNEFLLKSDETEFSDYTAKKKEVRDYLTDETRKNNIDFTWVVSGNVFGDEDNTGRFISTLFKDLSNGKDIIIPMKPNQDFYCIYCKDFALHITNIIRSNITGLVFASNIPIEIADFVLEARDISERLFGKHSCVEFGRDYLIDTGIQSDFTKSMENYPFEIAIERTMKKL